LPRSGYPGERAIIISTLKGLRSVALHHSETPLGFLWYWMPFHRGSRCAATPACLMKSPSGYRFFVTPYSSSLQKLDCPKTPDLIPPPTDNARGTGVRTKGRRTIRFSSQGKRKIQTFRCRLQISTTVAPIRTMRKILGSGTLVIRKPISLNSSSAGLPNPRVPDAMFPHNWSNAPPR
jgi:hypothetical protein